MDNKCLKDTVEGFNYNVQKVRFLAAIFVIISHAYPFSCLGQDPLFFITKGRISFGGLSVYTFLFLSGLYSTRTYLGGGMHGEGGKFLFSKIKRLCPSLFITITMTVLIIGPAFTSLTLREYLFDKNTWIYFLNSIFIVQHKLPGVFENNIYAASVNGSLWSLPLEVLCYAALTALLWLGIVSEKMSAKLAAFEILGGQVFICFIVKNIQFLNTYQYHLHLCLVFLLGALCYLLKEKIYLNRIVYIICILLLPVLIYFNILPYIWIFLFLYIIFTFCFYDNGTKNILSSLGNYSYEIYLVGALIQQIVCYFFGGFMNPYVNMMISIPLAVIAGIGIQKSSSLLLYGKIKNRKR